ncbi:PIN domain-containing protein [Candidatus Woesearchaeota archaeon]|nr:PIN domain-containing protein [Candidatus Woesearchaeota archaeon]MBI2130525.1 PIN domain-containing protein [Candidatus Woesearchaeota archaeon]MBI2661710.1 PIN domain-containing protein [Candidatus Woesearchaeota archaeon]
MTQFIDANVIIKAFTDNNDKEKCRMALCEEFVTNTLCLVEAQHGISTIKNNATYASNCIKSLFKGKGTIVQLDKNLLFESYRRIERYDLNIFDLINYVTALINNCSEFVSYDNHFNNLEIKRTEP